MPHDAVIDEAERRRLVGTKASFALSASLAALTIRSAIAHADKQVSPRALDATNRMLRAVDDLVGLQDRDDLDSLLNPDQIVTEAAEPFQAIARAASLRQQAEGEDNVKGLLQALGEWRAAVECDIATGQLHVKNKDIALRLQGLFEAISKKELTDASNDDRLSVAAYAVACR